MTVTLDVVDFWLLFGSMALVIIVLMILSWVDHRASQRMFEERIKFYLDLLKILNGGKK